MPEPDGPVTTVRRAGRERRRRRARAPSRARSAASRRAPRRARPRAGQRRLVDAGSATARRRRAQLDDAGDARGRRRGRRSRLSRSVSSGTRSQPPRPITTVSSSPRPLLADSAVADVDDAVGDRRRGGIVADDERGGALLARERGEQVEDGPRAVLVELARRLVGDEQRRRGRERGAERDPLLLAARELAGSRVRAVEEADPLEQLARARVSLAPSGRRGGRAGARRAPRRSGRPQSARQ